MKRRIISILAVVLFVSMTVMPPCGYAQVLPENGNIVFGNGTITINGQDMAVDLTTPQAIIEWLSFCIAQGYTVNFNMPGASSTVLNRVIGVDPSVIMGNLLSNGKLFLVNPNGILFGPDSYVNAPAIVASTLNISNSDFLNGNYTFSGLGGSVRNYGTISSPGGYVALLGSSIENTGTIISALGTVALAVGEKITMGLDPQGLISVVVDEAMTTNVDGVSDGIKNTGTISANGGTVLLKTNSLNGIFDNAINNEGIIEARSLENNKEGKVCLIAEGENSVVSNTGTIDVSPVDAGAQGGFIELSAGHIDVVPGSLLTGSTGEVLFDPWNITIGDAFEFVLQLLSGSATVKARNNINFNLGNLGGDHILNLFNFGFGNTFTLMAGNNIQMNSSSIVTAGGNIALLADYATNYGWPWGFIPSDGVGTIDLGAGDGLNSNGGNITLIGADIDAATLVSAGNGQVYIESTAGDINLGNNASVSGSAISVLAYNDIKMSGNSSVDAGNVGLADLKAGNDVWLGLVEGQNVDITAQGGDIYDNNGNFAVNIVAQNATLTAANGIGDHISGVNDSEGIDTQVDHLTAYNSTSGGINIVDLTGDLYVDSAVNNNAGGVVSIDSQENMYLDYVQGGFVTLLARDGTILDNNGSSLNIKSLITTFIASRGIGTSSDALETKTDTLKFWNTYSGDVNIENTVNTASALLIGDGWMALHSGLGNITIKELVGDMIVDDGCSMGVKANNGDVNLSADLGDIYLGLVDAAAGNVSITASAGDIYDNNGNSAVNIIAQNATLTAANGIGDQNPNIAQNAEAIETQVDHLTAYNSTSGSIQIRDLIGGLYVDSVVNDNPIGNVSIDSQEDMYLGFAKAGFKVSLFASDGTIIDNNGDDNNVEAIRTQLIAARGIGSASDALETKTNFLDFWNTYSGDVNIDNKVNASSDSLHLGKFYYAWNAGSGNVTVRELVGNMIADGGVFGVKSDNGSVSLFSENDMFLRSVLANGLVDIETVNGDIIFGGSGFSTGRVESLTSGVNLLANNGSVLVQTTQTTPHIIANGDSSILTPHGKITPTGTPLDVDITGTLSVDLTNYQISNIVNAPVPPPMDIFGNITGTITGGIAIPILTGTANPAPLNPPGYVYYNGVQIWPPKMIDNSGSERILASTEKLEKAYWEILDPYRYASFSADTPVFYLYHPLEEIDEGAFDDINLDTDAYEFIEENINLKKELNPYFGWLDDQETSENTI